MASLTSVHVVLSLAGIVAGFVAVSGLVHARVFKGWTFTFLATTIATNITGFLFPFLRFLPAHAVGIVSIALLALAVAGLYAFRLQGSWGKTYVISAVGSLYLNFLILVVQAFLKTPVLTALAPTQHELPSLAAHAIALAGFVWLGRAAVRGAAGLPGRVG